MYRSTALVLDNYYWQPDFGLLGTDTLRITYIEYDQRLRRISHDSATVDGLYNYKLMQILVIFYINNNFLVCRIYEVNIRTRLYLHNSVLMLLNFFF